MILIIFPWVWPDWVSRFKAGFIPISYQVFNPLGSETSKPIYTSQTPFWICLYCWKNHPPPPHKKKKIGWCLLILISLWEVRMQDLLLLCVQLHRVCEKCAYRTCCSSACNCTEVRRVTCKEKKNGTITKFWYIHYQNWWHFCRL